MTYAHGECWYLPWLLFTVSIVNVPDARATTTSTSSPTASTLLQCYDCSESFRYVWRPYTECQSQPQIAALRTCLSTESFCMVERVTYRSKTVGITRGCAQDCINGCYASGFGLTKLTCVSCCSTASCNTMDAGSNLEPSLIRMLMPLLASVVMCV